MANNNSVEKNPFVRIISHLFPPPKWRFPVIIILGIFVGLGFYVLYISNAISYLSDDPKTCVNCHVMIPQYATWERGSHGRGISCNDCHVPQDNIISKYFFKASDGLRHATYYTMRWEPQVIRIKDAGKRAVQDNCIRCHSHLIHPLALRQINNKNVEDQTERYCWDCHRETPHGRIHSLSSTPYARAPQLEPSVPVWLKNYFKSEKK